MKVNGIAPPPQSLHERPQQEPSGEMGKDDFLLLLTAQLAQQDPLNPMDNTEFVSQLSQFASLERLENMSQSLDNMAMAQSANTSAQVVSFIGKKIEFASNEMHVAEDGSVTEMNVYLDSYADDVEVTIMDENGRVVKTIALGSQSEGKAALDWDGTNNDGSPVGEGTYTVEVTATDSNDDEVTASTQSTQIVEGVSFENGYPVLKLKEGGTATLGDIREIKEHT